MHISIESQYAAFIQALGMTSGLFTFAVWLDELQVRLKPAKLEHPGTTLI